MLLIIYKFYIIFTNHANTKTPSTKLKFLTKIIQKILARFPYIR